MSNTVFGRYGRGFTLLEMLVVLAILAFAYALVPPMFVSSGVSTTELKSAARQLAAGLRKTRTQAIQSRKDAVLVVDVVQHLFTISGDNKKYPLPAKADLTVFTAKGDVEGEDRGAIRFHPDGSSTGGRITVASGERKFLIDVEWLTGRVEILE